MSVCSLSSDHDNLSLIFQLSKTLDWMQEFRSFCVLMLLVTGYGLLSGILKVSLSLSLGMLEFRCGFTALVSPDHNAFLSVRILVS